VLRQDRRAVIEAAENFRPDIAVMDIQMPGINGIEAIREIKRFCPDTVFLIMSAYDKFDYAKEALSLGVLDYLTKPLDREVFTEAMGRAMKAVDRLKEKRSSDLKTREKLETVVPVLETGFIYSLLLQDYDPANSDPYRELLDIHEDYGFIILVECGELVEKAGGASGAGTHMTNPIGTGIRIQNYYSRICGIVREFSSRAIIGQIMSNKIPVFVPHSSPQMDYNERTRLIASLQEMVTQLEDKTSVAFRVGIGAVHPVDDMKSSIAEAQNSLKAGTDTVSHADDLPVACEYDDDYPLKLEKSIFDSLQRGDADRAHDAAEQFFTWMEETQSQHVLSIRLKALEFVLWAEHLAYQEGHSASTTSTTVKSILISSIPAVCLPCTAGSSAASPRPPAAWRQKPPSAATTWWTRRAHLSIHTTETTSPWMTFPARSTSAPTISASSSRKNPASPSSSTLRRCV
jgi:two-component system response regulator YesN